MCPRTRGVVYGCLRLPPPAQRQLWIAPGFGRNLRYWNDPGHVSEASAANIFIVRKGQLITPPVTADILEGITRDAVMELANREMDIPVIERDIDRTELYAADEVFLSGTGFQIAPVVEVDGRPVGTGSIGPVVEKLQELYFKAARGEWPEYADWTVKVEVAEGARQ